MFSLVIPCHSSNLRTILFVVDCFMKEKQYLNEKIIIFNNIKNFDKIKNIIDKINLYNIKFKYKYFKNSIHPGIARNLSYEFIESEYVVFHDADDEPHPRKLEIIKYFFENSDADEIHHLFQPIELNFLNYDLDRIHYIIVNNEEIFNYQKKNFVLLNTYSKMPVSHGLISIKTKKLIKIQWNNLRSGEDRDFITKSIKNNNKIMIIEAFLSKYDKLKLKSFIKYHNKYYQLFLK